MVVLLISTNTSILANDTLPPTHSVLDYIDPLIGNVGQLLQPTRPTIQLPNQMMRVYPMRDDYIDGEISSFPLIIVSHRLGEAFSIMPWKGEVKLNSWKQKMAYDHDLEITRPWYYSSWLLDDEINVEFTPGKKTGIYRFVFPKGVQSSLLFSAFDNDNSEWHFISDSEIIANETYHDDIKIYMYGRYSVKARVIGVVNNNRLSGAHSIQGKGSKAWISFEGNNNRNIEFRYAISYISPQQARRNFEEELNNTGFDQLRKAAKDCWAKEMNQIHVDGGTEAQRRSFYTALYRSKERMVDILEDSQYYSGFDKKIHTSVRPFYVDDWTWDTYLALHPLRIILNPGMEEDMLNSYVKMYEQSGWMPTFPVLFGDHACMNGFHSSIMFLDDYRKGARNFDIHKAYEGMFKNATEATMLPWRNGVKTALDDFYYNKGFFPALKPGEKEMVSQVQPFEKRQAVAVTLGASYDDWAVGEMAKELGKEKDYQRFNARSNNYKNLWNNNIKMFIPKDGNGNWINIDPEFDGGPGGRDYYDENNGWTYLWQVQHNISNLISLMGGKDAFENKLDQLFRQKISHSRTSFWAKFPDATGIVGEFSMGNEPSFHIPYLYNYTSSPWKTQERIRFLLDVWFKDNIFGMPGDEDGGGMSAFVVFSSMGFYPVTPGLPIYTIGSPVFNKVTIELLNGKQFTMIAHGCSKVNKYIQSAKMNGQLLNTPWFTHSQLISGGRLELEMGPKPNKCWGITQ